MPRVQIQRLGALIGLLIPTFISIGSSRIRKRIALFLGLQGRQTNFWRFAAIILAIANLKNLPWVWHYRVFRGIFYHLWFQPTPFPPEALFKFMITKSHLPLWEIDYNIHKNNSTYFTDADVARTHLVTALLRRGIMGVGTREGEGTTTWNISSAINRGGPRRSTLSPLAKSGVESLTNGLNTPKVGRNMTEEEFIAAAQEPGSLLIMLGSVACFFHREILPYKSYEMWTRLLTWDKKWLYIVTYFVEPGTVQPSQFFLQPWKKPKPARPARPDETIEQQKAKLSRKIHATSIATYVIKKGRLTIPPEVVLQRSSLLPEKPANAPSVFYTPNKASPEPSSGTDSPVDPLSASTATGDVLVESLFPETPIDGDAWTWENVERERQRGLTYAKMFDGLNSLKDEFVEADKGALGIYGDIFPSV